jgi:Na+/H+ antiporter NhaD/arsenite permease-like protein
MNPIAQLARQHPLGQGCFPSMAAVTVEQAARGLGEVPVGPAISGAAGLVIGGIAGLTVGAIATVIVMHISEQEHEKTRRRQRAGYAY